MGETTVAKDNDSKTVTRISASDSAKKSKPVKKVVKTQKASKKDTPKKQRNLGPLGSFFGYFKGAWAELKEVRWPTRSVTWGLTGAVLAFSAFFVVFILLIDALFKYIFELILK